MSERRRSIVMTLLICSVALLSPARARAQARMEFIPSMTLFAIYDDNVFAHENGTAGRMLQLRPSFEGNYESARWRLLGFYSFDMQRSNFSSLNTLDARRHLLADLQYRANVMTTTSVVVRYDRSQTPGEISLLTGILGERRTAERKQIAPTFSRQLGQFSTLTGGYDFTTENLVDGARGTMQAGRLGLSRDLSARTAVTAAYVVRYFRDDRDDNNSHGVVFGWARDMAPGTRLTLAAGPMMTSYRGMAAEASATFVRATDRVGMAFDYWHGETIILGIRGPVAVDSAIARFTWPLTYRIEFGSYAGASHSTTIDSEDTTVYRGGLFAAWSPGGIYTVATTYDLDYQLGDIRNSIGFDGLPRLLNDEVLRHVFRVSVTVAPRWRRSILPPDEAARAKGVRR